MKSVATALLASLLISFNAVGADPPADTADSAAAPPAKVMLFGLFHFDNPGLDAVKFDTIDVMTPASQQYLVALAERLAQFKPTKILLEYNPANEAVMNQRYRDYLAGKYELERNEIYQLGFRVGKLAGLSAISSFDERTTPGNGALWEYMPEHEPATMQKLETLIADLSKQLQTEHQSLNLHQLLLKCNDDAEDRRNKDFYLLTNAAGADQRNYVGADASALWWQRNFRMYANIQIQAKPGERILVIAGQGHTAILRDLLLIDPRIDEESVVPYL